MNKSSLRRQLPVWSLFMVLSFGAALSYWWLLSSQESSAIAATNLQACLRLNAQIKKLREKPLRAGSEARSANELTRLIEASARKADLPQNSLVQIDPQPARRLGNSAYKEQPTHIELRDVTIKQLIVLLHALTDGESGEDLAELRLTAPHNEAVAVNEEKWTAEATLTHLIFAP
jgi:hypothetical protein